MLRELLRLAVLRLHRLQWQSKYIDTPAIVLDLVVDECEFWQFVW
jgi:hypothetical protein